jgi:hypothetical protein
MASQEWHWEQGAKYAVESIKTALLLNGAAAIALMTFAGTRQFSLALICPLFVFALGAAASAFAFLAAYLAQLLYGNAEGAGATNKDQDWNKAKRWNQRAVGLVLGSVILFALGTMLAAVVLPNLPKL